MHSTVPLCAFACAVPSTLLCLSNQIPSSLCNSKVTASWRTSNLPPLCSYWISPTISSRMHLFPPPVTATCVVLSLVYTAMLYFVHLCISQRDLQPLDPQSVDWMAVSAGCSKALISERHSHLQCLETCSFLSPRKTRQARRKDSSICWRKILIMLWIIPLGIFQTYGKILQMKRLLLC